MAFPNLFSKILPRVPMTDIYHHWPFSGYSAAGSPPCAISVLLTYSFSVTYSHASSPSARRDAGFYIVLYIQKILRIPRIRTSFFQIKVGTLLHGTLRPFGSEPTTPLTKDTSATLAAQWVCNAVLQKNLEIPFILLSYHNIIQKSDTGWLLAPRNEDEIKKGYAITAEPFQRIRFKTTKYQ